ncbi:MAG: DUF4093 domain-containing protein [Oscillospiraceae bacterium]|nr:DUF4093 domain-containing protein [Oscillospiraceae bacterium]
MTPEKPKLATPLIVEGKYDKIKLDSIVDALIIPTDGFRIFKDKQMRELIRKLAAGTGIAVLTDSDGAGFVIRRHLAGIVPPGQIINLYIPDVFGKEKRKASHSKEGKLGVEGIDSRLLLEAMEKAGLFESSGPPVREPITKADMYDAGLSGGPSSRALRAALIDELGLPARLSAPALPAVLTRLLEREEFFALCEKLSRQAK